MLQVCSNVEKFSLSSKYLSKHHRIVSYLYNNYTCSYIQSICPQEPTSVEQEPPIPEPKVEIPTEEVTKPEQELAEDSTEEVIIEPPQLPDPEAVKPSLSTTEVCVLWLCGVGDSVN